MTRELPCLGHPLLGVERILDKLAEIERTIDAMERTLNVLGGKIDAMERTLNVVEAKTDVLIEQPAKEAEVSPRHPRAGHRSRHPRAAERPFHRTRRRLSRCTHPCRPHSQTSPEHIDTGEMADHIDEGMGMISPDDEGMEMSEREANWTSDWWHPPSKRARCGVPHWWEDRRQRKRHHLQR